MGDIKKKILLSINNKPLATKANWVLHDHARRTMPSRILPHTPSSTQVTTPLDLSRQQSNTGHLIAPRQQTVLVTV